MIKMIIIHLLCVLATRRGAQQGSTYIEWTSYTPSARDTLKIYSDRTWFLHDCPISRRLPGMEKVMNKDLWAYGQYQSDTKIEEKVKVDSQGMARQAD